MEPWIISEIEEILQSMRAEIKTTPVLSLNYYFQLAVNNVLWTIVSGEGLEKKSVEMSIAFTECVIWSFVLSLFLFE